MLDEPRQPDSLFHVFELAVAGIDIDGELPFLVDVMPSIFVGGHRTLFVDFELRCQFIKKTFGVLTRVPVVLSFFGNERWFAPHRHGVRSPVATECPARQRLAGIPFALSKVEQAVRCKSLLQTRQQLARDAAFRWSDRCGGPFRCLHVVDGYKSRLTAHREPNIASR